MSRSSSKGGRIKRRGKVRIYGGIRAIKLSEEKAAIPKTLAAQAYLGSGMRIVEEDPAIANIVLQSVVRKQGQRVQVVVVDKTQVVGAIVDSAGRKIKAVRVRSFWRRGINASTSKTAERKVRTVRSRIEEFVPAIAKHGSRFESLLNSLRSGLDTPTKQAIDAVLEIQVIPIPEVDREETIQLLVRFIKKHRGTSSQNLLITVGAAIRKVLLNLPAVDLGLAVDLIKSEGSLTVPIGVELEVAKMVVQRVVEDPSIDALHFPQLADALFCRAKQYSTPNMVNREFYNATALNSVLGCILLRSTESHSLANEVISDSPSWFSRLCYNRLTRIRNELFAKKDPRALDLVNHINSLPFLADRDQKYQGGSGS
jgi:hypothetical protein